MKADVRQIIAAHVASLNDAPSLSGRLIDAAVIYGLPFIAGAGAAVARVTIDPGFYGISISVFAVFSALLLNTQIAIFGIFGREREMPTNAKEKAVELERLKLRNDLISQLNTNISYLMIFSVLSLFVSCGFYIFDYLAPIETFATFAIYVHFSIVVIVVIKRAYALFANEYAH